MATMSGTVFATNSIKEDGGLTGPTQLFFEVCDNLFAKSSTYRVIDKNGKDVTSQFLNDYQDYYFSGNYQAIWNAIVNRSDTISWENELPSPQLLMNGSASESFYKLGTTTEHMPGKSFEMLYTVSGTYKYHDGTGQISEYSNAVLNIESFNAGALFSYEQFGTSTNAKLAADKKSVTFSAEFSITLCFNSLNLPGISWWEEDFGPYKGSVTGYTY